MSKSPAKNLSYRRRKEARLDRLIDYYAKAFGVEKDQITEGFLEEQKKHARYNRGSNYFNSRKKFDISDIARLEKFLSK